MQPVEVKMFNIAKHFDRLNDDGEVKALKANENGYANVFPVKRGLSFFVHHLLDGSLKIDLEASKTAKEKYPKEYENSLNILRSIFGNKLTYEKWNHKIDKEVIKERYLVDVTEKDESEIIQYINEIIKKHA
jgi:hypothetical protein